METKKYDIVVFYAGKISEARIDLTDEELANAIQFLNKANEKLAKDPQMYIFTVGNGTPGSSYPLTKWLCD